jgi:3-dehydroquinate synthase
MLEIQSQIHSYRVRECTDLPAALREIVSRQKAFFLVDRKVAELHERLLTETVSADCLNRIEATEHAKSYEQLIPVFCRLLDAKCQRGSLLVVIGGGVLQDIGCFIASVLFRGVRWILIPTTLLAQCDSCIGSKSSLNISHFKNQLGTFYPPHEVLLNFEFLRTLGPTEILSGLGEAIKLHLIDGDSSVDRLRQKLARVETCPEALPEIVWDSLRIKKRFIEQDEFDKGVRNLLNYGHTFAHSFESATDYAIPHGIAVSLGVACATYFSEQLGLVMPEYSAELRSWLRPFFGRQERTLFAADPSQILGAMKLDKKNQGDGIMFVLTRGAGKMEKMRLELKQVAYMLPGCVQALL